MVLFKMITKEHMDPMDAMYPYVDQQIISYSDLEPLVQNKLDKWGAKK